MVDVTRLMSQRAPFPDVLAEIVACWRYRPGWRFRLVDDYDRDAHWGETYTPEELEAHCVGLTLIITTCEQDAYHPETHRPVNHLMPVPAASYNEASWRRWVLEQCLLVEAHEACEHARLVDDPDSDPAAQTGVGFRPWAPLHGSGNDPYTVREFASDEARRTSFRNVVKPEP